MATEFNLTHMKSLRGTDSKSRTSIKGAGCKEITTLETFFTTQIQFLQN
jgi:hypothetical protein